MRIVCYNSLMLNQESYRTYRVRTALRNIPHRFGMLFRAFADLGRALKCPRNLTIGE